MPRTGWPSQRASHRRLPGCAGAPWRSMRAPSSVSPPNTGSSGSSALAPATMRTWAPARRSAASSSATTVGQRATADLTEAAAGRRKGPLPAAGALDLDALADGRGAEPAPPLLLVEVAGLQREEVDLLPGRREQRLGGLRHEARALRDGDLARPVAHVVAQHAVQQALERRRLPSLRDGLHALRGFAESGWPLPPPRTAWISAMIASAI